MRASPSYGQHFRFSRVLCPAMNFGPHSARHRVHGGSGLARRASRTFPSGTESHFALIVLRNTRIAQVVWAVVRAHKFDKTPSFKITSSTVRFVCRIGHCYHLHREYFDASLRGSLTSSPKTVCSCLHWPIRCLLESLIHQPVLRAVLPRPDRVTPSIDDPHSSRRVVRIESPCHVRLYK